MSGGTFNYLDSSLKSELFGWTDDLTRIPNVLEDREISELTYDLLTLLHEYDWYKSGDTEKDRYLDSKAEFKKKWLSNRGVRVRHIIDGAIQELKEELYETYGLKILRKNGERIKMLSFNIDSGESAAKLIHLCEKYHGRMEVDVIYGRYIIDGCSMLGVHSLIGNTVSLEPQSDDKNLLEQFGEDLERIK